jgi:steroid delta-isomerase-like uncharacterized protein
VLVKGAPRRGAMKRSTQNLKEGPEKMPTSRRDFVKLAGTGALGLIVGGAAGYTIPNFAEEQSKQMLREYVASWNAHDVEKILSFFTDDGVYEHVPRGENYRSKDELKAWVKGTFDGIPDFKIDMTSLFGSGNMLACEWVMTGTNTGPLAPEAPATGKSFSVRGSSIVQMKEGRIQRNSDYWDLATFYRQLGLMQ